MKKGCLLNTTILFPSNFQHTGTWKQKEWKGLTDINGANIWSDGDNIYYSNARSHYILNGDTWETKVFGGDEVDNIVDGAGIWTDGTHIYYSGGYYSGDYILNGDTWETKVFNKPDDLKMSGIFIWNDGANVYYSYGTKHYRLNGDTWEKLEWDVNFIGNSRGNLGGVWSDGENIYHSFSSTHYILNGNTWEAITWNKSVYGDMVWTDGTNIYYSHGSLGQNYVLNSDVWEDVTWSNLTKFGGYRVWSDGTNIYYSYGADQYVLDGEIVEPEPETVDPAPVSPYLPKNGAWVKHDIYKQVGNTWVKQPQGAVEVEGGAWQGLS